MIEEVIFRKKNPIFDLDDEKLNNLVQFIYNTKLNVHESLVLERVRDRYRWPKFYNTGCPTLERIINKNGDKTQDFFSSFDNFIVYEDFLKFYKEGYTFILSGVQYLFEDIAVITDKMSVIFGVEINSNMYISKGIKSISFPYHDHDYSVIVKNVQGKSLWTIDDKEYVLEKQNVFYIEKNKWHCVKQIIEPKISITFNLN
jgi:mannose-6-phosphate isomerase-like protein (cupin superfamily)